MKLETTLTIYRSYSDEEIDRRVKRVLDEITAFANIETNQALWVEQDCDCVYMRNFLGSPMSGDRIHCSKMPAVILKWLECVAEWALNDPDEETVSDEYDDEKDQATKDHDLANKTLRVVIEDFDEDPALRIRMIELDGDVADELIFVAAVPIGE